ncbi:ScbA/BarX family gamma-butyrolactone biosynthesis protein [Amycolatopsis saalfeldensis]|uniref:A-factor biosynthesis hotdog domain-containing protein n=1 Tax=Amycolatopsis saalfeldensis TaxID=394193 RepID=A0A1H8PWR9_9PSEU|nr:ScbA/BarX family gamma-butyrolactone biosynthesis protein [Amycolatopsis saalfeldensis]SEO46211.1 A-factor biosynthesis hotdog domain-containing protein [Amycolatopsis saalfeldensis]
MVGTLLQKSAQVAFENTVEEAPPGRVVDFQQTIPRSLVHRAAVSEVFVTDLNILGSDRFEVGAQWPRRHSFFGPCTPSSHDPMLYAETCRQAGLLIAHRAYGVPQGHSFLSDSKTYAVDEAGLATTGRPIDVVLQVTTHDVKYRGRNGGMRLEFECYRDGQLVGTGTDDARWVCSAVYRRLRGRHFAATPFQAIVLPTVAPALVGRDRAEDVLVAETAEPGVWSLQFDPDHAVLFDHAVDHVPGMMLVEAARQVALLKVGDPRALPVRASFEFKSYVEFDADCLMVAEDVETAGDGTRVVRVVFEQDGVAAAVGTLAMRLS